MGKKIFKRFWGLAAFCLALGLLFSPGTAFAEDVTYPGDPLQNIWGLNVVAPSGSDTGKSTSLSGNKVTINGGTPDRAYGALNEVDSDAVTNNQVIVNDGTINTIVGGFHESLAAGSVTATGNSVTINGGAVSSTVYGGQTSSTADAATAAGNSVVINNGSVFQVTGGRAFSLNGTATATGNSVFISGGTANNTVSGGSVTSTNSAATATGNSVVISGGTVNDTVNGGFAQSTTGTATATGNSVTISGSPIFGAAAALFGGWTTGAGAGDAFTGNTLNLKSAITVLEVRNFEYLNFYLPATMTGGPMLTVTGTADLTYTGGLSSIVNVGINGFASPLRAGDAVILIDAGTLTTDPALNTTANGQGMQGVTLKYEFDITATGTQLLATVTKADTNEQAKAFSEGYLAGVTLLNQNADLAAGKGMYEAVNAAGYGLGIFGTLSGGWSRYDTGSHVDLASISLMTGLSWGKSFAPGRLTLGAFLEYGNGSYDTYNSFRNAASIHGDGDIWHLGAGLLGRMDFVNNIYAEGSLRIGTVHNEYTNADLSVGGINAEYDADAAYYGAHLGAGYLLNINERNALDFYGKYFWTRQGGDEVVLSTGDPIDFKSVNSHRLRLGGRYTHSIAKIGIYGGAAWEYEFSGKGKATSYGYAIKAPSLQGNTGIGEIGVTFKASPFYVDFGVQGYVGKREGVTGSIQAKYEF
jgi:hypothetical protein